MTIITQIAVGFVAVEHLYILYMEMFAWETLGRKTFKQSLASELFTPTKMLAANQGLYNGFLAAGLIWSLFIDDLIWQKNVAMFFLICVAVAGIFGTFTASKKIFFVQTIPAVVAILLVLLS